MMDYTASSHELPIIIPLSLTPTPNVVVEWLTLLFRIPEVRVKNSAPATGYRD
jgi:hypothetical protein